MSDSSIRSSSIGSGVNNPAPSSARKPIDRKMVLGFGAGRRAPIRSILNYFGNTHVVGGGASSFEADILRGIGHAKTLEQTKVNRLVTAEAYLKVARTIADRAHRLLW